MELRLDHSAQAAQPEATLVRLARLLALIGGFAVLIITAVLILALLGTL